MKNGAKAGCCGSGSAKRSPCYSGDNAVAKDVNFNEWAGKQSFVKIRGASDAYICIRLVQDIRHQARQRKCLCGLGDTPNEKNANMLRSQHVFKYSKAFLSSPNEGERRGSQESCCLIKNVE